MRALACNGDEEAAPDCEGSPESRRGHRPCSQRGFWRPSRSPKVSWGLETRAFVDTDLGVGGQGDLPRKGWQDVQDLPELDGLSRAGLWRPASAVEGLQQSPRLGPGGVLGIPRRAGA